MKSQALLYSKDKSKILKYRLLRFLFGALRFKFRISTLEWNWGFTCDYSYLSMHANKGVYKAAIACAPNFLFAYKTKQVAFTASFG